MATQAEIRRTLPADVDGELSWTERELPERERTKHVHRLHPYLGKFVPQLVEVFLGRFFQPGQTVLDPFAGSGTTLVEASCFGAHAVGIDISAFNCLLAAAKTRADPLGTYRRELPKALAAATADGRCEPPPDGYLSEWYAPRALAELLAYRRAIAGRARPDLLQVVLSRSARSARRVAHHDLDFPRAPVTGPYACRKHARTCRPTAEAAKFLRRYTDDTLARVDEYQRRRRPVEVSVLHGDARALDIGRALDGIITSPPYPGRIDYHAQHQYAYELLGLTDRRAEEIGAAAAGTTRAAVERYVEDTAAVFRNAARFLPGGAPVVIVIEDSRGLYDRICELAGLVVVERRLRHVNRRTGRRQGEYFEQVLVCQLAA
jgi:DNA methylase